MAGLYMRLMPTFPYGPYLSLPELIASMSHDRWAKVASWLLESALSRTKSRGRSNLAGLRNYQCVKRVYSERMKGNSQCR